MWFKVLDNGIDFPDLINRINFYVPSIFTHNHILFHTNFVYTNYLYYSLALLGFYQNVVIKFSNTQVLSWQIIIYFRPNDNCSYN